MLLISFSSSCDKLERSNNHCLEVGSSSSVDSFTGGSCSGTAEGDSLDSSESSVCGDGAVGTGEICDDGNIINELSCGYGLACRSCNSDCSSELNLLGSFCGDGVVDDLYGEECDDGNQNGSHYCDSDCTVKDNFVSIWEVSEGDLTITIPLAENALLFSTDSSCNTTSSLVTLNYNFTIDWGDETAVSEITL